MDQLLSMKLFDSVAVSIENKLKFTIDKERMFISRLSQSFSSNVSTRLKLSDENRFARGKQRRR